MAQDPEKSPPESEKIKTEAKKSGLQNQQYGKILLARHLKDCQKNADGFSVGLTDDDNLHEWNVMLEGPEGTLYEGGYFQATLTFPEDFPNKPPKMKFNTPGFWHPNVYNDGTVCISILHEAKEDEFNPEERMDEKWRPILSVEAILISVLSMLSDPNFSSPANIDASVQWKDDQEGYKKRIRALVRKSQEIMMGG